MDKHGRIILASCVMFLGLTPISNDYSKKDNVESEFKNLYGQVQDKQFTIVSATPTLTDLQDGQIIIWKAGNVSGSDIKFSTESYASSTTYITTQTGLMFRLGNEIYKINASCVTVTR